jgi:hypothetical protein
VISTVLRTIKNILLGFIVVLLILDILVVARALDMIRFPFEISDVSISRQSAYALLKSYEELASSARISDSESIVEALHAFRSAIDVAATPQQVAEAIGNWGGLIQDTISSEQGRLWKNVLLDILNRDPGVKARGSTSALIVITSERDGFGTTLRIDDKQNVLTVDTKNELQTHELFQQLSQLVEIEVVNGKAQLLTPSTVMEKMQRLNAELDMLTNNLKSVRQLAGKSDLAGEGVIVKVYDVSGGYTWDEIVHDKDIRDIINELCFVGAKGIEVGNQRIVVGSSVRCVGPIILVNQRPISVNPVVIKAVGPKDKMAAALDKLKERFGMFGKELEIAKMDNLTISAYQGGR